MVQTIFGSPVIILKIDNVKELLPTSTYDEIINHLMEPDNTFINHSYARGGKLCTTDLNSNTKINDINGLPLLWEFLKNTALTYAHLYSDTSVKDLTMRYSWINLTFQGCEIKNHNDKDLGIDRSMVVTFYPKVPEGGANLVFIHNSKYSEWVSDQLEQDLVQIEIQEGNIVIFDNLILHAVGVHKAKDPRMCIATEFTIET
jgi:hypothetical protein